jgi:hypothetical protein
VTGYCGKYLFITSEYLNILSQNCGTAPEQDGLKGSAVAFRQDYTNLTDKVPVYAPFLPFTARMELRHTILVKE